MLWVIPAAMAGAGLLKGLTIDRAKEKRDRRLAAETQRLSPWTGLRAEQIREADPLGSTLQFGTTGLGIASGIESAENSDKLSKAMAQFYGQGGEGSMSNMQAPAWGRGSSPLGLPLDPEGKYTFGTSRHGWGTGS